MEEKIGAIVQVVEKVQLGFHLLNCKLVANILNTHPGKLISPVELGGGWYEYDILGIQFMYRPD